VCGTKKKIITGRYRPVPGTGTGAGRSDPVDPVTRSDNLDYFCAGLQWGGAPRYADEFGFWSVPTLGGRFDAVKFCFGTVSPSCCSISPNESRQSRSRGFQDKDMKDERTDVIND
jgi:hypothetical protein